MNKHRIVSLQPSASVFISGRSKGRHNGIIDFEFSECQDSRARSCGAAVVAGLACLLNPVLFAEFYVILRLVVSDPLKTLRIFRLIRTYSVCRCSIIVTDRLCSHGAGCRVNLALAYRLLFGPDYAGFSSKGRIGRPGAKVDPWIPRRM
jgi:hypothetical protein